MEVEEEVIEKEEEETVVLLVPHETEAGRGKRGVCEKETENRREKRRK